MKRAQIKMFESLAVLVVFFFFLIFGASFYFKLQESSLNRQLEQNTQLRVVQIAQKTLTLPEISCSGLSVERENCVDVLKVQEFSRILADPNNADARVDYFKVFENSDIRVVQIYPQPAEWDIYSNQDGDESRVLQIPVLIYNALPDTHSFGYIEVRVYA